jgi:hypothetical protein
MEIKYAGQIYVPEPVRSASGPSVDFKPIRAARLFIGPDGLTGFIVASGEERDILSVPLVVGAPGQLITASTNALAVRTGSSDRVLFNHEYSLPEERGILSFNLQLPRADVEDLVRKLEDLSQSTRQSPLTGLVPGASGSSLPGLDMNRILATMQQLEEYNLR